MNSNSKKNDTDTDTDNLEVKWQSTCSELRSAFNSWDKLPKLDKTVSPDEKKLQELKSLIQDIKEQIQDFND